MGFSIRKKSCCTCCGKKKARRDFGTIARKPDAGPRKGRSFTDAASAGLSNDDLEKRLNWLNALAESMNAHVTSAWVAKKLKGFDREGWHEFLDYDLPTMPVPGLALSSFATPHYSSTGPVGWREYFKVNQGPVIRSVRSSDTFKSTTGSDIDKELNEYQTALADWYDKARKSDIKLPLTPPKRVSVDKMPGPIIAPAAELEQAAKAAKSAAMSALTLGGAVPPWALPAAALTALGVAAAASLAPYALALGPRRV